MIHGIALIIFALFFCWWLAKEFKKPLDFSKHQGWLVAMFIASILATTFSYLNPTRTGNFVMHAVGGGIATALVFEYFKRQLKFSFNWRIDLMFLFALVSSLGVLNELFEFAADTAGLAYFSFDRKDTWRDLLANTLGALICWVAIKFWLNSRQKNR